MDKDQYFIFSFYFNISLANNTDNPTFNWAEITPSRSLQWHPCYSTQHDCARLDVPMDWQDPSDDKRVVLAIIRLRASNLSDYRGPVFFNPGGPGGSGIWSMLDHGEDLQTIIGQNHDLVTFDPRGVGNSVPRIECWKHAQDRALWELQDIGVLDAYPGLIYDAYARAQVISRVCESNEDLAGKDGILAHSSTVYHARDMLEILEQMGETGLKYWGFSYGTVLGGIFAALWPQKVERMVNDGNVDYQEWYTGAYLNFLRDTDKVMSSFYHFCHLAGPLRCAFYSETPSLIETRLTSLLEKIRLSPIPIEYNISPSTPQLITYTSLKLMLSTSLYQPVLRFPPVAEVLAALEARNATPYYLYTTSDNPSLPNNNPLCFPETVVPPSTPLSIPQEATPDAFAAIMCSDALLDTLSPQEFEEYHQTLQNISHISGSVQVNFRLSCVGREIRPKWRKPKTLFDEKKKTRFPILFVNNIGDNVTPLVSARRNSELFEKSVVLVQEGYGHTSLAAGSRCMAEKVRGYFQEGKVTGEGRCGGMLPFGVEEGEGGGEDELGMVVGRLVGRWRGVF
ncbi:TAP-like protein-domain-containing protein [Podospora fimiseda]|uniref:TAP-like protein-domain-containing protein n=1 Tax=Podospora fimiseda TaxID=252190 RepID=A0AAN7H7G5_9PEZI|nr:TAP-like protein-domain-containing protein [Podospora fimiseda]